MRRITWARVKRLPSSVPNLIRNGPGPAFVARRGSGRHCVNCDSRFGRFLPHRGGVAGVSEFLRRAGYNTGCFDDHACPVCGIGDRERHLIMYFDALGMWDRLAGADILHVAPEWALRPRIERLAGTYIPADLFPHDDRTVKMDLMSIDAADASFDFVICNHVLEHVPNVRVALSQIHRVLRSGGQALLQTPYATRLQRTFEDPLITGEQDRLFFYGQEDHARLLGLDLFDQIAEAGLAGGPIPHVGTLDALDAYIEGVSREEPLILVTKVGPERRLLDGHRASGEEPREETRRDEHDRETRHVLRGGPRPP